MVKFSQDIPVQQKQPDHQKLLGKSFNNLLWRKILRESCKDIDQHHIGLEVISPFGFELLENKHYLTKNLRRFYAYLGAPKNAEVDKEQIIRDFKSALLKKISTIDAEMLQNIVIIIENQHISKLKHEQYTCKPTDILIDIQFRARTTDIITDYANYLITVLDGLQHHKGEGKGWEISTLQRWRLYQLYVIQEKLFGHLITRMTEEEYTYYKKIFSHLSNRIHPFYQELIDKSRPNKDEYAIINHLIKPRISQLYEAVTLFGSSSKITLSNQAYHSNDHLHLTLDLELYQKAKERIKRTYLEFE